MTDRPQRNETDLVGLVLLRSPSCFDTFNVALISGLEEKLLPQGLQLLVRTVTSWTEAARVYRSWSEKKTVVGIFVTDLSTDDPRLAELESLSIPMVILDETQPKATASVVSIDNAASMTTALEELTRREHRFISRLCGPTTMLHTQVRSRAYEQEALRLNFHGNQEVGDYSIEGGADATSRLLDNPQKPTAIICDNDLMAIGCLEELQRRNISVPDEISVIAWDDSPQCLITQPPLSALHHDVKNIGELGAEALIELLNGGQPRYVTAPPLVFIERGSVEHANPQAS